MLIGVAFYSLVIGIISAFFTSKDTKESLVRKKLVSAEEFSKSLNIEEELRENIADSIQYASGKLAYLWLSKEQDIFGNLSVQLKYDFLVAIHKKLILSCEFFRNRDVSFIVRVVPLLKPLFLKAGEALWLEKDFASSLAFISEGELSTYVQRDPLDLIKKGLYKPLFKQRNDGAWEAIPENMKDLLFCLQHFTEPSYIGEVDIIFNEKRATHAVANCDSHLMILSRSDFESVVLEEFPHIYMNIKDIAFKRAKRQFSLIKQIDSLLEKRYHTKKTLSSRAILPSRVKETQQKSWLSQKPEDLYDIPEDLYPMESLLKVSASGNVMEEIKAQYDEELELLATQFEDCKEQFKLKLELEGRIKASLKNDILKMTQDVLNNFKMAVGEKKRSQISNEIPLKKQESNNKDSMKEISEKSSESELESPNELIQSNNVFTNVLTLKYPAVEKEKDKSNQFESKDSENSSISKVSFDLNSESRLSHQDNFLAPIMKNTEAEGKNNKNQINDLEKLSSKPQNNPSNKLQKSTENEAQENSLQDSIDNSKSRENLNSSNRPNNISSEALKSVKLPPSEIIPSQANLLRPAAKRRMTMMFAMDREREREREKGIKTPPRDLVPPSDRQIETEREEREAGLEKQERELKAQEEQYQRLEELIRGVDWITQQLMQARNSNFHLETALDGISKAL